MITLIRFFGFAAIALTSFGLVNGATYRVLRIDPPNSSWTGASDINDAGVVTGTFRNSVGSGQGFVWELPRIYHVVPYQDYRDVSSLNGINSLGTAVGNALVGGEPRGLIRAADGQTSYIDLPFDHYSPWFNDIDDFGRIIGHFQDGDGILSSFVWLPDQPPRILDLPDPPSGCQSSSRCGAAVSGINNIGWIFGSTYDDNVKSLEGFLYRLSDGFSERVVYPGAQSTHLRGINDLGDLVGYARMPSGPNVDFLRNADGSFEQIQFPEFSNFTLEGINNSGDLVGSYHATSQSPSRAFVAWSVPEPTSLTLVLTALSVLAMVAARRIAEGIRWKCIGL